jgi:hypothetical protein
MATITLGKDYTVDGLTGASDLTYAESGEKLDVSTRTGTKPYKQTKAGLVQKSLECTVFAEASTQFAVGEARTVKLNGGGDIACIVTSARRSEPKDGIVTYQLTLKPGTAPTNTASV